MMDPPPQRTSTASKTLDSFLELLGSCSSTSSTSSSSDVPSKKHILPPKKPTHLKNLCASSQVQITLPSLALRRADGDNLSQHHYRKTHDKSNAMAFANRNLASPITLTPDSHCYALHNNIQESFELLINARLRAYVTLLARHGLSLAAADGGGCSDLNHESEQGILDVERKLQLLIELGSAQQVTNLRTWFALQNQNAVTFFVAANVESPVQNEPYQVNLQASGTVNATFDPTTKLITSFELNLRTHQLLDGLVNAASKVMTTCLKQVRDLAKLTKEAEMAAMATADEASSKERQQRAASPPPPPAAAAEKGACNKPKSHPRAQLQNDLPAVCHQGLPVVSPDFGPRPTRGVEVPPLQLSSSSSKPPAPDALLNVEQLSVQTCAKIVDDLSDSFAFLQEPPPFKKRKLAG